MEIDRIKALLKKYYEGETSLDEEHLLHEALQPVDELPEKLKADGELFRMMAALGEDDSAPEIQLEEQSTNVIELAPQQSNGFSWLARIAAGFALLVVGLLTGWFARQSNGTSDEMVAIRKDLGDMKQLVALNQLQKESASERIMATYEFKKLDSASDEILDALIYTFRNDDNPNVKNAAAEALYKFGNHDKVRKAFIKGLSNETDPLLQIRLIDMLVGLNEKRALPKLQEMMQEKSQMKVVKQKAAEGIGRLL